MTVLSIATSSRSDEQPTWQAISDTLGFAHDHADVAAVNAFVVDGLTN